jgi:predicted small secreted protein
MKVLPKILTAFVAISILVSLTSCNTTRGFGRDLRKVGYEIEEAANRVN